MSDFDTKLGEILMRLRIGHIYEDQAKQAITSLIKELVAEARLDELERAKSLYSRTYKQEVTDNVGNVYVNDSHGYISSYEVQERIAELKAQQEEL